jgi:hypothetical protein
MVRAWGIKVLTVQEARSTGYPDESQAAYALRKGLVLLTCDRDFLNARKFPLNQIPTIIVFDFGNGTKQEMARALRCVVGVARAPHFYDKWSRLHAHPDFWTEEACFLDGTRARAKLRVHKGRLEEWVDSPRRSKRAKT